MVGESDGGLIAEVEGLRRRVAELEGREGELDDTKRRLERAEERLRLFIDYTPASVVMLDREMRYIAASRAWMIYSNLEGQDIVGRSHYDVFPDIPDRWREIHRRCLAGATEGCEEDPFPRADGSTDWLRWQIYPWRTADGEIGGIVLFTELLNKRKDLEEQLRAQAKIVQELSTPIIPITDQILVMPVIGALSPERADQMMDHLLRHVAEHRVRVAILDITGVPAVDTHTASALVRVAQAVRLLGARVMLTGIRPEVAQAMIALGVDISSVATRADLQSGIKLAMNELQAS